uniref:Uncharacterized protein n=1 Tax=Trichogramma kaykai TaxID=54128 RepID=A0ABD2WZN7_9HYME
MASTVASLQHEVSCQLVAFLQRLDTKLDNLTKHVLTIEVSVSRLEGCIGALETQSGQQAAEIVEIRADIVKMKKTANSVPASAPASVSSSLLPSLAGSYLSDPYADAVKRVTEIHQPRKKLYLSVPLMQISWS